MAAKHPPVQLALQTSPDGKLQLPQHAPLSHLTPPGTPTIEGVKGSPRLVDGCTRPCESPPPLDNCLEAGKIEPSSKRLPVPLEFLQDLELRRDASGKLMEYGRGAWSVVYMALSRSSSQTSGSTPPASPATANRVLAVKTPIRRDAHSILQAEALILTRLNRTPGHERHIIQFHGYISSSHSIVMSAVPLALSTYIEYRASTARQNFSTRTMFDPVLGIAQWRDLSKKLIESLDWVHNHAHVVHGDIKPHNILLRPRQNEEDDNDGGFPYDPVFVDFSSSHVFSPDAMFKSPLTAMSALTPPFTAPELLSVSSLKSPGVISTTASDVFSLAVTLLAAATGDLLLYPGLNSMQRLAMSRDGHRVLDYVRSGSNGSRIPRNGLVEKTLKPAVSKDPNDRITAQDWLSLVDS